MSYRAVRLSNRKRIIRRDSSKYLSQRSALGLTSYPYSAIFRNGGDSLDLPRAADKLQSCSAQQSEGM
eukprot:1685653-Pyramimonas_sp.AAC.1